MGADPLKGAPLKGLDKRDAIRKDEILSAIVKSGRSYEEIMNWLVVEVTERVSKDEGRYALQLRLGGEG